MVNVGGPSRGCVTCIRRKIRCDQQRPSCGQCQRSILQCGGYRNTTDIMFRDQSQAVATRVRAESSTLPRSPRLDPQNGLITFFTNNFACGSSNRGTNLFWLPDHFPDLVKTDIVNLSTQCVGAMALARLQRSYYYYREAQRTYGQALLNLAEIWRQQAEIDKDSVLVTILFLGFFEILASYENTSRQSWTTHVGSLGSLLRRRNEQFHVTDFGARMALQSQSQAILNALQTHTSVPEEFRTHQGTSSIPLSPQLIGPRTANVLLIRLAELQAKARVPGPTTDLKVELDALEQDLRQWSDALPSAWSVSKQTSIHNSDLWWASRHDLYATPLMAHVWNQIRVARIIVHGLLLRMIHSESLEHRALHTDTEPNRAISQTDLRNLITDICATIPESYRPSTASLNHRDSDSKPTLGATYWLLWPLEIVGSMQFASQDLKDWVEQTLERIFNMTGIMKAQVAVDRLKARRRNANVA